MHCLSHYEQPPLECGTSVTMGEPTLKNHYHSKCIVYIVVGVVYSMGLEKCVMRSIHHYNITQSIFIAVKTLCALLLHLSPPLPLAITDLFIVPIVLSFQMSHC